MKLDYLDIKDDININGNIQKQLDKLFVKYKCKGNKNNSILFVRGIYNIHRSLNLYGTPLISTLLKYFPKTYCVYKLFRNRELVYVGSSYRLERRLYSHTLDKDFDEVHYVDVVNKTEMLLLENFLIDKYRPINNKSCNLKNVTVDEDVYDFKCLSHYVDNCEILEHCIFKVLQKLNLFKIARGYEDIKVKAGANTKRVSHLIRVSSDNCACDVKSIDYKPSTTGMILDIKYFQDMLVTAGVYENMIFITNETYEVNGIIFTTLGKYRYKSKRKWYKYNSIENLVDIISKNKKEIVETLKVFPFGKFKGKIVEDIKDSDPDYIEWCIKTFDKSLLKALGLIK